MKIKFVKKAMTTPDYQFFYDELVKKFMTPTSPNEKKLTITEAKLAAVERVTKEFLSTLVQQIRSTYQNLKMDVQTPVAQNIDNAGTGTDSETIQKMQERIDTATRALQQMFEHIEAAQKVISTGTPEGYHFSVPRGLKHDWSKWQENDKELNRLP